MQTVILAAGKGKRLHPITTTRSKAMLPILGKPIVERVMEQFASQRDFDLNEGRTRASSKHCSGNNGKTMGDRYRRETSGRGGAFADRQPAIVLFQEKILGLST
jgi:NDP-sugar pyrophosphorylase family protein